MLPFFSLIAGRYQSQEVTRAAIALIAAVEIAMPAAKIWRATRSIFPRLLNIFNRIISCSNASSDKTVLQYYCHFTFCAVIDAIGRATL